MLDRRLLNSPIHFTLQVKFVTELVNIIKLGKTSTQAKYKSYNDEMWNLYASMKSLLYMLPRLKKNRHTCNNVRINISTGIL